MNVAQGERLAWQERKALSFTFSALHCGGRDFGYRASKQYGGPRGISLGTAMAISGAAANSGMGFYSSPLKSFLLTLLNARLGWWLGNPKYERESRRESPVVAFNPLLKELFSLTGRNYPWLNVSDGGHFDNTGVYEMLRRKCKRVVLFDAETSRKGITNAARRARVDFGADLTLVAKGENSFPCDYYRISYEQNQRDAPKTGELLRFFPVVTDECAWTSFENWFYKSVDTTFPDDPLLNQFFAETAFESYRLLGLGTVDAILAKERALSRTDELDLEDLFTACVKTLRRFPWVDENKSDLTASSIRNCAKESPGVIVNTQQKSTRLFSQQKNRIENGECALLLVKANVRWNHTGLFVKKGEEYKFFVLPGQWWLDAGIPSTADGYRYPLIEWWMSLAKNLKHLPEAKWMALGGAIGENDTTAFLIGKSRAHTIDRDGELICFANDARWFFWNNVGHMWVSILRVG